MVAIERHGNVSNSVLDPCEKRHSNAGIANNITRICSNLREDYISLGPNFHGTLTVLLYTGVSMGIRDDFMA